MKNLIMALVITLSMVSISFGQWVLSSIKDEWTGDTLKTGVNFVSSEEHLLLTSEGSLGIFTTYSLSVDFTSNFTKKKILVRTPDGAEYSFLAITEPSFVKGAFFFLDEAQAQIIELMKQHAWIKVKLEDYDDNDHILTINCVGFTKTWNAVNVQ